MVGGVLDDVIDRALVLVRVLDHLRPEAAAEEVVASAMPLVELARVAAVEIPHTFGQVRLRRLDDEVVVVPHQAACMDPPAVAALDACEDPEEERAVSVVANDRHAVVPARADVVQRTGGEGAAGSCHATTVAARGGAVRRRNGLGAEALRRRHVPGTRRAATRRAPTWLVLKPRPSSARGAGATGSSRARAAACAGRACPCASSRGNVRRRRRAHRLRSALR